MEGQLTPSSEVNWVDQVVLPQISQILPMNRLSSKRFEDEFHILFEICGICEICGRTSVFGPKHLIFLKMLISLIALDWSTDFPLALIRDFEMLFS